MNVRDEIAKRAAEADKPILNWLFDRYHMASQWRFVARCRFEGKFPLAWRVWYPTDEGRALHAVGRMRDLLARAPCDCPEQETGIGMLPGHDNLNTGCFRNQAEALLREHIMPIDETAEDDDDD